jgi:hypothetical protein
MEPKRYVPNPDVEIEAIQWFGRYEDLPARWRSTNFFEMNGTRLIISTPHGPASPELGDYVAFGPGGEYYPIPRAIFEYKWHPKNEAN